MNKLNNIEYAGFWIRVAAAIIDSFILVLVTSPILYSIYGKEYFKSEGLVAGSWDIIIKWIFPAVAVIVFWIYKSATPGKMILGIKIVDMNTGNPPSPTQSVVRYLGYYVSMIPLMLGIIWVAFDEKKQGWHDKLAGTVVIKD